MRGKPNCRRWKQSIRRYFSLLVAGKRHKKVPAKWKEEKSMKMCYWKSHMKTIEKTKNPSIFWEKIPCSKVTGRDQCVSWRRHSVKSAQISETSSRKLVEKIRERTQKRVVIIWYNLISFDILCNCVMSCDVIWWSCLRSPEPNGKMLAGFGVGWWEFVPDCTPINRFVGDGDVLLCYLEAV